MSPRRGRLVLVGAGPGDPELLTLRAVRALRDADVLLVDDLVDRRALAHARPDARIVDVGKRGGCKSTPQRYIERLIVREALAGNVVVRLKGGDPLVFGRGGEELEAATHAGIDCEIVSGVTSGIAAAASGGFALTHRGLAQGAIFVTGHAADGGTSPDWAALVATRMTLVVYMGVAHAAEIRRSLLDAGMSGITPVAIVERASCDDERTTVIALEILDDVATAQAIQSPAILVIGAVAGRAAAVSSRRTPAAPPRSPAIPPRAARAAS